MANDRHRGGSSEPQNQDGGGPLGVSPRPAAREEPAAAPAPEKKFRVMETANVPRGPSTFRLAKGTIISSRGYSIDHLKAHDVKLEEVVEKAKDAGKSNE